MQGAGEGDREHRQRHSEGRGVGYVDRAADGMEQQKAALAETIAAEKKKSPTFTKDEFKMALCNYRKIDVEKLEGRRKLIDTFVNSVFLYDDHLKIIYNGKEKEEVVSLKELESSKTTQIGQPAIPYIV